MLAFYHGIGFKPLRRESHAFNEACDRALTERAKAKATAAVAEHVQPNSHLEVIGCDQDACSFPCQNGCMWDSCTILRVAETTCDLQVGADSMVCKSVPFCYLRVPRDAEFEDAPPAAADKREAEEKSTPHKGGARKRRG